MENGKGLKAVVLSVLMGCGLFLLSGCYSGVSQKENDVLKQQLAAKEQENARLQEQHRAAPQEPKRLEAKITVVMDETPSGMFFATSKGVKGGPFRVPAGKTVGLHLVNQGDLIHELMIGQKLETRQGQTHGYEVNLFRKVAADIFVYPSGAKIEVGGSEFDEIEVGPGADLWLRVVFPAEMKGEWEMGCFVHEPDEKSHYEQGMMAKLIIE